MTKKRNYYTASKKSKIALAAIELNDPLILKSKKVH